MLETMGVLNRASSIRRLSNDGCPQSLLSSIAPQSLHLVTRSLVTELELLYLDERIRANPIELGFEVAPPAA